MKRKNSLLYLCTGVAFLLILGGFIFAAVTGNPGFRTEEPEATNYDGKIAAMRQSFEGNGIHAVMIDDPSRGESLYFDRTGAVRRFAKNGTPVKIEGSAEEMKRLSEDFFESIYGVIPSGDLAADEDFAFDEENYKVFLRVGEDVTVLTYREEDTAGSAIFTSYRQVLTQLDN